MKNVCRKLTLWLCVLAMLVGVFASCVNSNPPANGTTATQAPTNAPETPTEAPTQAPGGNNNTPGGDNNTPGGDDNTPTPPTASAMMTFGQKENGVAMQASAENGFWSYDIQDNAVKLALNATESAYLTAGFGYRFGFTFATAHQVHGAECTDAEKDAYVRVLYSAMLPDASAVDMVMIDDLAQNTGITWESLTTTGDFVLTDAKVITDGLLDKLQNQEDVVLAFKTTAEGCEYKVKAVFFFKTEEDANKMTLEAAEALATNMDAVVLRPENWLMDNMNSTYEYDEENKVLSMPLAPGKFGANENHIRATLLTAGKINVNHKYIRIVYAASTDAVMNIYNLADGNDSIYVEVTATAEDEFALTPVTISSKSILRRIMINDRGLGIGFGQTDAEGYYAIKAICFFTDKAEAEAFTMADFEASESPMVENSNPPKAGALEAMNKSATLTFGAFGTAGLPESSDENGNWEYDQERNAVKLNYTNANTPYYATGYGYRVSLKFAKEHMVHNGVCTDAPKDTHMRVLYSVKNPEGVDSVDMVMIDNLSNQQFLKWEGLTDTNGFALTDTTEFPVTMGFLGRFQRQEDNVLAFKTKVEGGEYYVRAVFFFKSEAEANAFTLEKAMAATTVSVVGLTFGENGNGVVADAGNATGNGIYEESTNSYVLPVTNRHCGMNNFFCANFKEGSQVLTQKYVRVLYSVENHEGDTLALFMYNNGNGNDFVMIDSKIQNTNGFVLSSTAKISDSMHPRYNDGRNCPLGFANGTTDGIYKIKAIYFFDTQEEADAFTLPEA